MTAAASPGSRIPELDPLQFPLSGSHLIEASAGTGKTWTIAALYLRLVLGHGGQPARLPADILVLTFTDAAALELRDRIRSRLAEAAACFADALPAGQAPADPFLQALRAAWPADQQAACARILDLAAQSMDEAAISTIHGWCARVLQEHAFDSGSLFEQQLQPDLAIPIRQTAWDYWRAFVAPLDALALAQVLEVWPDPQALLSLADYLTQESPPEAPDADLNAALARFSADQQARLQALKAPWVEGADTLGAWLAGLGKAWNVQPGHWQRWLRELRAWACDPAQVGLDLKTGWERLSPQGIGERWRGDAPAPAHPLCDALADLPAQLAGLPTLRSALLPHAMAWMAQRLQQILSRAGLMGFDGLLTGLDAALAGARGEPLAQTLRRQFPVVLIDEFQDTDPVQYRIFDRIYRVAANEPDTALVFIGDPKQSIYGFRGADVHTYLQAGRACAGRTQTLGCNYRSSTAMVDAVNRVFAQAGAGAFPTGLADAPLVFQPVQARGRPEHWEVADRVVAALSVSWVEPATPDKPLTAAWYEQVAAERCARKVAETLRLGRQGLAGMRAGCSLAAVRPADLAILVNTHVEARSVRLALARQGVRSVYLSERDSVYESPQAAELVLWLDACVHPEDERAVRAALATPVLGLSWQALERLVEDERAWDVQVERFQAYHQIWQRRGVLPMLRQLLHDFDVPARLLADGAQGERCLTDILHLAELLQQAAAHLDGERAVLRHLQLQCLSPQGEDARRLRLESDEDLVRVVTVHKSKGLEYPLVFLPFPCRARVVSAARGPWRLPQGDGRHWVMEADALALQQLDQERLGEDVRKLYVALTRARHAVWMALGPLRDAARSGIGHLLGADLHAAWDALVEQHPGLLAWDAEPGTDASADAQGSLGAETGAGLAALEHEAPLGPARQLPRRVVVHPWWISSYSALCLDSGSGMGAAPGVAAETSPETAAEDVLREGRRTEAAVGQDLRPAAAVMAQVRAPAASAMPAALTALAPSASSKVTTALPAGGGLGDFPRGSEAGTFLHGLLEWAAQRRFQDLSGARDLIARRCAVRGWETHIDVLHDWLLQFARTAWPLNLPQQPVLHFDRLQACLPEMEFWLPVHRLPVSQLDQLITRRLFAGISRPPLSAGQLNGMFKGFIDLALQADGRYYIVDYKSNDLGRMAEAYQPAALVTALCAARYDVQMILYVLALHRQLRARLPDYEYARHMGGAVYLFLRGQAATGQGVLAVRPDGALIDALDALFDGPPDDEGAFPGAHDDACNA